MQEGFSFQGIFSVPAGIRVDGNQGGGGASLIEGDQGGSLIEGDQGGSLIEGDQGGGGHL